MRFVRYEWTCGDCGFVASGNDAEEAGTVMESHTETARHGWFFYDGSVIAMDFSARPQGIVRGVVRAWQPMRWGA